MGLLRVLALLSVVAIVGCGRGREPAPEVTPLEELPAAQSAKAILTEISESGQVGSGAMELRENLEELNQGLVADLDALEAMSDPEKIKAKASEMLGKVGGAAPQSPAGETPAKE